MEKIWQSKIVVKCNSVYLKHLSFKLYLIAVRAKVKGVYVFIIPRVSKSKELHRIPIPNLLVLQQIVLLSMF
jgi:hypothetical protein